MKPSVSGNFGENQRFRSRLGWPALVLVVVAVTAVAASPKSQPSRRASPPAAGWDEDTTGTFYKDAFSVLQGPRPEFGSLSPNAPPPSPSGGGSASVESGDGFKWSTLVSGDTLTDEIKDMKERVAATCETPSTFKGGGYGEAQKAFSAIALAFGLIAAHDEEIRWKSQAATARDLFARVGFNCKVGTDGSFKESKLRVEDLEAMLQGNPPQGKPDRDEDFRWSQVSGRPPLMTRLEAAEKLLGAATASQGDFSKQIDVVLHEAEIVAAIGQVIQQADFEYHDDDSYRGYASSMRDAAVQVREGCLKNDYAKVSAGVAVITKSCNDCHGDYR